MCGKESNETMFGPDREVFTDGEQPSFRLRSAVMPGRL